MIVKSRDLVDSFIESGEAYVVIDVSQTGRTLRSVYNGLLIYLAQHNDLGISVRKDQGDIFLVNNAKHRSAGKIYR